MITKADLYEAIAECKGKQNPDANTCIKLSAYYTILDHMEESGAESTSVQRYSYSAPPDYKSDTEFAQAILNKSNEEVLEIIDELMTALQVLNPKLYKGVMRKLL